MQTVHATCILIGRHGVLIRGASGAGKTALAGTLIRETQRDGGFACLVADDRVALTARNGRLVARVPAPIAGRMEIRGSGIVEVDHEPAAVVRLVVDLVAAEALDRMPDAEALSTRIDGIEVARQPASGSGWTTISAIQARIAAITEADAAGIEVDFP
ncbi:HPr kinase/phosphorylase [Amorphus suaedae]